MAAAETSAGDRCTTARTSSAGAVSAADVGNFATLANLAAVRIFATRSGGVMLPCVAAQWKC